MRPARFVTLCFLYSGALLVIRYPLFYRFRLDVGGVANLGVGLIILLTGLVRLRYPEKEERKPSDWGPMAYGMAFLATALTAIFLAQLLVL